jgi:glycosyltransferase involved in cell wall biosynthesis
VHYISNHPNDNEGQFIIELNAVLDKGYDAIHLHTPYWTGFIIEEIAKKRGIPVVIVHSHSTKIDIADEEKRNEASKLHEKVKSSFNMNLATHFCACSDVAADWLFGEQISRDKIRVLHNAIDTEKFSFSPCIREKHRTEFHAKDSFLIGFAGRFCYQKNPEMLIDIFINVSKHLPQAKLLLIGIGEMLEKIKERVFNCGLSEKVIFLGYRTNVSDLLQAMDVFLLPSRFEGLPITLVEAQCSGLHCLTSEYVTKETKITPLLEFLPYDTNVWAKRIREIAGSRFIRDDMSNELDKAGYSLKSQIKVLEDIYSNIR